MQSGKIGEASGQKVPFQDQAPHHYPGSCKVVRGESPEMIPMFFFSACPGTKCSAATATFNLVKTNTDTGFRNSVPSVKEHERENGSRTHG